MTGCTLLRETKKEVISVTSTLPFLQDAGDLLTQLPRGAFLSVKAESRINTMTIGWGSIGFIWGKPVLMVMVRTSRYTYGLINESNDFSVSVPLTNDFRQALAEAGKKSGRDIDKFTALQLRAQQAREIESPVIDNCGLIYECRLLYRQPMDLQQLDEEIVSKYYSDGDYHVLYFGEIAACYKNNTVPAKGD